jgi:hypothetical protein
MRDALHGLMLRGPPGEAAALRDEVYGLRVTGGSGLEECGRGRGVASHWGNKPVTEIG